MTDLASLWWGFEVFPEPFAQVAKTFFTDLVLDGILAVVELRAGLLEKFSGFSAELDWDDGIENSVCDEEQGVLQTFPLEFERSILRNVAAVSDHSTDSLRHR